MVSLYKLATHLHDEGGSDYRADAKFHERPCEHVQCMVWCVWCIESGSISADVEIV